MTTIADRIAELSPAKQKLLEVRKKQRSTQARQYPLSYGQKRLWFLDQLEPGNPAYNIVRAVRLEGVLDTEALRQALTELVRRHEILRTRFKAADGIPGQEVQPCSEPSIELIDLSSLPPDQQREQALRIASAEAERHFDLEKGGLFIAKLVCLGALDHLLMLNTHHIVSDGWSTALMVREITSLYDAYRLRRESLLPELPLQYGDFAIWQEKWVQSASFQQQLAYWKRQLGDDAGPLELNFDQDHASKSEGKGAAQRFTLDAETTDRLRGLARRTDSTTFMVLLAAFSALLYRYSERSNINVGTPIAGRNRLELEELIGFFTNTLVMRTCFSSELTVAGLLEQVRSTVLEAHANQDVPLEMLVEALRPGRELYRNPLFQVMFVFQNTPREEIRSSGLIARTFPLEKTSTKFDLTLTMMEQGAGVSAIMEYRSDLFDAATIARMVGHLCMILKAFAGGHDHEISLLPLLSEEEKHKILERWNSTERAYAKERRIHRLFERQVERTPDATALEFNGRQMSYRELNRRANQVARRLLEHGVGPEARVGLLIDRSAELIVAAMGVLKAGGAYVPMELAFPEDRLRFMMKDAQISILLTEEAHKEKAGIYGGPMVVVSPDEKGVDVSNLQNQDGAKDGKNLAYVLYTSGSTGRPKGVCIEHRQLTNYVRAIIERMGRTPCSFAMVQPLSVDASVTALFPPLLTGGCVYVVSRETSLDAQSMKRFFVEHKVEGLKIAPSHLAALHRAAGEKKNDLMPEQLLVLGGEASPWSWMRELHAMAPECALFNQYGPTETAVAVLVHRYGEEASPKEYKNTPLGLPLANTQIYILDSQMQPAPFGVRGEIYIGGANVGRGYFAQPTMTAERYVPNPFSHEPGTRLYRTGDYGRWTEEGQVEFLGRGDDQVKIRGHRVECAEIETVLREHVAVDKAIVLGRKDQRGEQRLVACVVSRAATQPPIGELRDFLRERLPEYMVPAAFVFLPALPLTPHGKLDRQALPAAANERTEADASYVAPETQREVKLAGIFAELLGVEKVGIHDNFFELGGHSLLATRVIAQIRSEFCLELPLRALFEEPTIAGLAKRIEQEKSGGQNLNIAALVKRTQEDTRPLSYSQQRLWFLQQLDPRSATYNVPVRLNITGLLNKPALKASFDELVRRHEILRTLFVREGDNPVQISIPELKMKIAEIDLRELELQDRHKEAARLAEEEAKRAFDLREAPLMRVVLLQLGEQEHVLIVNMHHIISDGWSMGILGREMASLYRSYAEGGEAHLKALPIQYADYAAWQREWLQGEALEEQLGWWRKELAGLTALELPSEGRRDAANDDAGAIVEWELSPELAAQVRQLCEREGVTLFMTLVASFQVLLSRYTRQNDIAVATLVAGRRWSEIENLIGFFVNTLVLRTRLDGKPCFREVLRRVRESSLKVFAHQDVPFEKLVEELQPDRTQGGTPLFQVMFMLQNVPRTRLKVPGLEIAVERISSGTAKFALTMAVAEAHGQISGGLSYRSSLFSEVMMKRLLDHWKNLLREALNNPETSVNELPLLSAAENRQLLEELNLTHVEFVHRTIHEQFETQVKRTPNATAVEYEGKRWSYAELNWRANQLSRHLRKLGVGPEKLVGVCLERSIHMVVSLLAVLKAGAAYVPLDPDYPDDRLNYMLQHSRVEVLLVEQSFQARFAAARVVIVDDEWESIARESGDNLNIKLHIENTAYVIYTSGSTGKPKGVVVSHAAIGNHMHWMQQAFAFGPQDRILQKTAFSFDASVWEFYAPLLNGGCLVLARPGGQRDGRYLLRRMVEEKITVVQFVPSQLQMLVELDGLESCRSLAKVYCGGETLSMDLVARLYERAPWTRLYNLYGPTEATIDSVFEECKYEKSRATAYIGKPVANMRAYVVDETMHPVPAGVWGEMYLGGAGLARAYVNQPEMTAERFVPDPFSRAGGERLYRTGDIVRWRHDEKLEFMGRCDHQVKLRGFRIELAEIEAVLSQHEDVTASAVVIRGEAGDQRLVAYVATSNGPGDPDATLADLKRYLQRELPEYMVPKTVIVLDKLPLTPHGKVDRHALSDPETLPARSLRAPRTTDEKMLCQIFSEVLKRPQVGLDDNFFDLGGHSLLAIRLITQIEQRMKKTVSLAAILQYTSIERLATLLVETGTTISSALVVEMKKGSSELPLFFVHGAGGSVSPLRHLARSLDSEHSFFAFQDPEIAGTGTGESSIEAIAAEYVQAMRKIQPSGPYLLGGWSMGGLVAFEMARQLRGQSETVELLALVDSYPRTGSVGSIEDDELLLKSFLLTTGFSADHFSTLQRRPESLERWLAKAEEVGIECDVLPPEIAPGSLARHFGIYRRHVRASLDFKPQSADVVVNLWQATEGQGRDYRMETQWKPYVSALHVHQVPGDHFTGLHPPRVADLASQLSKYLRDANTRVLATEVALP